LYRASTRVAASPYILFSSSQWSPMRPNDGFSTLEIEGHHVDMVSWLSVGSVGCRLGWLEVSWGSYGVCWGSWQLFEYSRHQVVLHRLQRFGGTPEMYSTALEIG